MVQLLTTPTSSKPIDRAGYHAYIRSDRWKAVKARYLKSNLSNDCFVCKAPWNNAMQFHHKTYKRLGCERLTDICPVCNDCHLFIHRIADELSMDLWAATHAARQWTAKWGAKRGMKLTQRVKKRRHERAAPGKARLARHPLSRSPRANVAGHGPPSAYPAQRKRTKRPQAKRNMGQNTSSGIARVSDIGDQPPASEERCFAITDSGLDEPVGLKTRVVPQDFCIQSDGRRDENPPEQSRTDTGRRRRLSFDQQRLGCRSGRSHPMLVRSHAPVSSGVVSA